MWERFLSEIRDTKYVVQRNWEHLPESTEKHNDLDIFVCEEDRHFVEALSKNYPMIDVRYPGDGYYPPEIEKLLLEDRRELNGFWIPSEKAHFLSLYYHNLVHKQNDPYCEELKEIFLSWMPPTRCIDQGVGYFV